MNKINLKSIKLNLILFIYGSLISVFSFLTLFIIEYSHENYIINSSISITNTLKSAIYCLFIAVVEEGIFRYLFLKKWLKNKDKPFNNTIIYLCLISSFIFGFLHLNLNEFPILQINNTLAGISLFYAVYQFRNIYIAVGMHFSWNFIQGVIFPFAGSGKGLESIFIMRNTSVIFPEANYFIIISILLEFLIITWMIRTKCFSHVR